MPTNYNFVCVRRAAAAAIATRWIKIKNHNECVRARRARADWIISRAVFALDTLLGKTPELMHIYSHASSASSAFSARPRQFKRRLALFRSTCLAARISFSPLASKRPRAAQMCTLCVCTNRVLLTRKRRADNVGHNKSHLHFVRASCSITLTRFKFNRE
jgi:hypothetical protein